MESNSLQEYLNEIVNKSLTDNISWLQITPLEFQWASTLDRNEIIVTIQKSSSNKDATYIRLLGEENAISYLFQIVDKANKKTLISISSKARPEFYNILKNMFQNAQSSSDRQGIDILKKLLRD